MGGSASGNSVWRVEVRAIDVLSHTVGLSIGSELMEMDPNGLSQTTVGSELFGGDSVVSGVEAVRGSLDTILNTIERREIVSALKRTNGQRTLAAKELGISRSRLYRRMEALGIDPRDVGLGHGL